MSYSSKSSNTKKKSTTTNKTKKTNSTNKTNSKQSIEQMKYEIANEFGVSLGADASSRSNGTVGGEMTKRLVKSGMNKMKGNNKSN